MRYQPIGSCACKGEVSEYVVTLLKYNASLDTVEDPKYDINNHTGCLQICVQAWVTLLLVEKMAALITSA